VVTQVGVKRLLCDHLNPAAQECFEVEDETRRKPRTRRWTRIYKHINIALRPILPTCHRPEDTDVVRAMLGDALDVIALFVEKLMDTHTLLLDISAVLQRFKRLTPGFRRRQTGRGLAFIF